MLYKYMENDLKKTKLLTIIIKRLDIKICTILILKI